jgi:hypothetical protein
MGAQSTKRMISLANQAATGELTVRDVERLVKEESAPPSEKRKTPRSVNPFFREAELALAGALSTKVKIIDGKGKKTLCIEFADEEQLKGIIKHLGH